MGEKEIAELIKSVVEKAIVLKNKYTEEKSLKVDYVTIFAKNKEDYKELLRASGQMGEILQTSDKGNLYKIKPIQTKAGEIFLLKIRHPNNREEKQSYVDFRVNYTAFKKKYSGRPHFKLVIHPMFEIIELSEEGCEVWVYFPDTPLSQDLGMS